MSEGDLLDPAPTTPAKPVVLNTEFARVQLRKRFAQGEWALMEEVAPSTGGGTRYADAVAVNLWKSRGHAIHGIEIKVSRADWLRELKHPEKAESVCAYCNHWWIVAPADIVKDGELPPNWGLLVLRPSGLVQSKAAPALDAKPIDIGFFASLMRRGVQSLDAVAEARMRAAINSAHAEIDERVNRELEQRSKKHNALREQLDKVERETGLVFNPYNGPDIRALKLAQAIVRSSGWRNDTVFAELERLATQLDQHAQSLRAAIAEQTIAQEESA